MPKNNIYDTVEWIMNTLYGEYDLTFDQRNELLADVTALVKKWEDILNNSKQ